MKFIVLTLSSLAFLLCGQVAAETSLRSSSDVEAASSGHRKLFFSFFQPRRSNKIKVSTVATGDQEVPPVVTNTEASLELEFDEGFTEAEFDLDVEDGQLLTQAHLHCGRAGENGDVLALLFNVAEIPGPGGQDVDGNLASGTLSNSDLLGVECNGIPITTLASLYEAILSRSVYLNLHSEVSPPGIVRGQLFP